MSQGFTKGTPIDTDPTLSLNSDIVVPSQKAIKTYVDGGLSDKVNRSGDTMSGFLVLNGNPVVPLGAATKDYVDTLINGIDWKQAADAGTVAALPTYTVTGSGQILTGTTNGAIPSATTDNVTLTANQRVLVKNETSTRTPNNGIYVVTQVGSGSLPFILTRASDANTPALLAEATLSVKAGTVLANTQWHCNPAATPIVIGTTNITFAQIGGGTYTFSPPLSVAGNIVSIPAATSLVDGYLSATNFATFSAKVPSTRTITINGNTQDLSTDRSWTITVGGVATIGATIDGSGGTITLGQKGYVQVPYACTINSWRIIANAAGSIVIDVWKTAAPTIPTVANTITGSAKPTLSSQQTAASSTLTGWTTSVAADDIIGFNVNSATTVSWVILQLIVTKI